MAWPIAIQTSKRCHGFYAWRTTYQETCMTRAILFELHIYHIWKFLYNLKQENSLTNNILIFIAYASKTYFILQSLLSSKTQTTWIRTALYYSYRQLLWPYNEIPLSLTDNRVTMSVNVLCWLLTKYLHFMFIISFIFFPLNLLSFSCYTFCSHFSVIITIITSFLGVANT